MVRLLIIFLSQNSLETATLTIGGWLVESDLCCCSPVVGGRGGVSAFLPEAPPVQRLSDCLHQRMGRVEAGLLLLIDGRLVGGRRGVERVVCLYAGMHGVDGGKGGDGAGGEDGKPGLVYRDREGLHLIRSMGGVGGGGRHLRGSRRRMRCRGRE